MNKEKLIIILAAFVVGVVLLGGAFERAKPVNYRSYSARSDSAGTNSVSTQDLEKATKRIVFNAIEEKKKSGGWNRDINTATSSYSVTLCEELDDGTYRICGKIWLKDDYGDYAYKKRNSSSSDSTATFEVITDGMPWWGTCTLK